MIPTESTLVTSSYVNTPPTDKLPVNVADVPTTFPENPPLKVVAVIIPDELIFLEVISPVVIWSLEVNATLPVLP
mgnify:CR=1 FL=1